MSGHLYDLGIIGNCAFNALIDKKASIKWLCWPKYDSSFVFGSLLDENKGGSFDILPSEGEFETDQYYLKNTNVLKTRFTTSTGSFQVTDFAPRFENFERFFKPLMLIRKLEPLAGNPRIRVSCKPKGEYGSLEPNVKMGSNHLRYIGLEDNLRLTTDISHYLINESREFVLSQTRYLVLTYGIPLEGPLETTVETFLQKTTQYWRNWVKSCSIGNIWQEEVIRSALTLKMHQFEDTGAIIASCTTSLPEHPGSTRNWDYRYCWMRDSYYTLKAFYQIGHFHELEQYSTYIENLKPDENGLYGPVYSLLGDQNFDEEILDLEGYLGNKPVRIGNQAREHVQNDVYGQILVSITPLYTDQRFTTRSLSRGKRLIMSLLKAIEKTMDEPDAGLWELRNSSQRHCYTFLFHWAGTKAAIKIAKTRKDNDMLEYAEKLNVMASAQIERCYKSDINAYAQCIETSNLDAAQLQLITMGYLDPNEKRTHKHLEAIEKELKTPEGLLYRYKHQDDFGLPQSTFLICSYWYAEALAVVGRVDDAIEQMENLLQYQNHLGLLSEDVDAKTGSQWGNFPQTYSHVGLMNAAFKISNKLDKPEFL
ncbi:MAG: glycoside hydrolase family 15 protein [Cytophagales bacterium]